MGMILCLRCGEPNSPDENYCEKCGATLPKLAYAIDMASVEKVNERYMGFVKAAEMVKSGEWSIEEFEEFMEKIYNKLKTIESEIGQVPITEEIMEDFEEELDVGFAGVKLYNEGMKEMMEFIEDENPVHLDEGLIKIRKGNEQIHRARIINRDRDKRLGAHADLYRQDESITL
ncbi:MAG: zinc ribbon domain-containing protein [Candidatus Eremiobacteraeota bacterium]|nr:zinc ribbon domain-containing protein [Candidatus Eremiobacteraeota bacterium]